MSEQLELFEDEHLPISDEQIKTIAMLADEQLLLAEEIETYTELLKTKQAAYRKVAEVDLPAAMSAAGVREFKLQNGRGVSIETALFASIPKKNKKAAVQWLVDHGQGSIVNEDVIVRFEKGQQEKVQALVDLLFEKHMTPEVNENVNTGTVKSIIKELQSEGVEVPLELFGAYWKTEAKIK